MKMAMKTEKRRGRPPKRNSEAYETRELLLRAGLEVLTEKGFSAAGIDEILRRVQVPKGSFYHYFKSKEAFGEELIRRYAAFFAAKLDKHFGNESLSPLERIRAFAEDARAGMVKYEYRRGCLVGNLGQEINVLPESFREQLRLVFRDWQERLARNLRAAQEAGQISASSDCEQLAAFFWIGWEGAVLRTNLEQNPEPIEIFIRVFLAGLPGA